MEAVAAGNVRLEDLAAAFAGCPRVTALCDNYLSLPGVRPPPPFNPCKHMQVLANEHGIVLVIGEELPGLTRVWIIVARTCQELVDSQKYTNDVHLQAARQLTLQQTPTHSFLVFSMDEDDHITAYGDLTPCVTCSWLKTNTKLEAANYTYAEVTDLFNSIHSIDIITTPDIETKTNATTVYSRNTMSDFLIERGVEAIYGPPYWH